MVSAVAAVVGSIRLYLEPSKHLPAQHRESNAPAVVDVAPEDARRTAREWRRRGYTVMMVAI